MSRQISRKGLTKKLDALWARAVKLRDKYTCQKSGIKYPEDARGCHAHHIFTKGGHPATRWDIDNGITLNCGNHRGFAHAKPYVFRDWMIERKGQEWWDERRYCANVSIRRTMQDLETTYKILQEVIEEMEAK